VVLFVALLALAVWVGSLARSDAAKPKTHTVAMEAMRFQPETITVAPGDTIIWINKDLVPHTATSEAGRFDSKDIQTEQSWKYTTRNKGDFAYVCTFHPTMKGMLRVK
jgi:plastocyanin